MVEAVRTRRPGWLNARTAVGVALLCASVLAGQRVLENAGDTVQVWVAARDLAPGTVLAPGDLRLAEVGLSPELRALYVGGGRDLTGHVLGRAVLRGELVSVGAVGGSGPAGPGRTITIPVEPQHALGGRLRIGDRIDVFATFSPGERGSRTRLLVAGAEVVDLVSIGGVVTGAEVLSGVTVAVGPLDAARIAFAVRNGVIDVARVEGGGEVDDGTIRAEDLP